MSEELKKKTDEALAALAQAGDKPAVEELLRRHAGLVRGCARRYFLVGGETEDLIQEGMIGLYRAAFSYDAERETGRSFKNFAYLCVTRQILDEVKKVYRKKNSGLITLQPLDVEMVETGLSPEDLLILNEEQKEFRQRMSRELSDFEFKITTMYMDGMTCAEICEATGKPAKSVDNAIQRSRRKLLKMFKR